MGRFFTIIKATLGAYGSDKLPRLAASIAYATIFAVAPLMIVVIAIAGFVLGVSNGGHGQHLAENALLDQVRTHLGGSSADAIRAMITASFDKPRQSITAQILGWITFALGAAGLFGALQDALNAVWHVEATKGGWKFMLRDRLASFGMIVVVGFLLLVTFAANGVLTYLSTHSFGGITLNLPPPVLEVVNALISFAVVTMLFAAMFKVLPDVSIRWRDVWSGAAVTAALFVIGEWAISFYISTAGVASGYGAAGAILVALIWVYYAATIILLGAEYTKFASRDAKTIQPSVLRGTIDAPAGVDPRKEAVSAQAVRS